MLEWTDDLIIGIDTIDQQHKGIFEKANDIFHLGSDASFEEIKEVFIYLMDYATNHFFLEEELMIDNKYEFFDEHKKEHNYFIEMVNNIYNDLEETGSSEMAINSLKGLLTDWLGAHIKVVDWEFVQFINGD